MIRFFSWLWFQLPRGVIRWLGSLLGYLWFDVLRFRRQIILNNLDLAFPDKPRDWKIRAGRHSVRAMGSGLAEFFTLPFLDRNWFARNVVVEGGENLAAAREQGRGVYLLSLHMGAYDVAVSGVAMMGYDTYVITKFFKTKWFNDIWFSIRGSQGVKFIEPHGEKAGFAILKALKRNACVLFVQDQFMGKPFGVETTFFGIPTGSAMGLALFVLKTRSPVIPCYSYEGADAKMHMVFGPAVDIEPYVNGAKADLTREQKIVELTQKFGDVLEGFVRRHPEEWMWVHRRWKTFE